MQAGLKGGCDVAEGTECEEDHRGCAYARFAGTATEKLAMFEKLKAAGGFANASAAELRKVENMLRTFADGERKWMIGRAHAVWTSHRTSI
jgi:hypothetical protein